MALPNTFANKTAPVMDELDQNFNAVGNMGVFPCTVTGTNSIVMTPLTGLTPNVASYSNFKHFCGIAAATNTSSVQARIGGLTSLPVYKDSPNGPVALEGGEIIVSCAFTLIYNASLNSGNGGFHLVSNTAYNGGTINGTIGLQVNKLSVGTSLTSITRVLSTLATVTFSVVAANSSQQQTLALSGAQVNDIIRVGPPASVVPGTSFMGYVLAAGTVAIVASNVTAATVTPTGGLYRVAATGFT